MSTFYCQPCKHQSKQVTAPFWCLQCDEPLCENCCNYHKVLKITKNHITVNHEEHKIISEFVSAVVTKCEKHTNLEMEYFCPVHAVACCSLCKQSNHGSCKDVGLLEGMFDQNNLYKDLETLLESLNLKITAMDTICKNTLINIDKLETQNKQFLEDIKKKRTEIDSALDKIESQIKAKFDLGYQFELQKLVSEQKGKSIKYCDLKRRQDQLMKIIRIKPLSDIRLFFAKQHLCEQSEKDKTMMNQFLEGMIDVSCKCSISVAIDINSQTIKVNDVMSFTSINPTFDLKTITRQQPAGDQNETGSSTEHDELSLRGTETDKALEKSLEGSTCTSETLPNTEIVNITQVTSFSKNQITCKSSQSVNQNRFKYVQRFFIKRRNPKIFISCFKHLLNGLFIFGESSTPCLLVYNQSGNKKGDIKLKSSPQSIAVVDEYRAVVTVGESIVFANVLKFTTEIEICFNDKCNGIALINNTVVVNCETKGMHVLNLFGLKIKTIDSPSRILFLTAVSPNTIVSTQLGSGNVQFLNMQTLQRKCYKCANLKHASGITSDKNCNIYVSCEQTHNIYLLPNGCDEFISLIDSRDLYKPKSIDYNENESEMYVINHDGKAVYTFRRT